MRAIAVALAGLVLAGVSVTAFDVCQAGATNVLTSAACCPAEAPPRRRRLFSRAELCSDGSTPCCTTQAPGPPVVSTGGTTNLQCGRNFGDDTQDVTGGVTYTLEPCPTLPGQTCFHVTLTAAAGQTITDIHLAILDGSVDPNTLPNGLGNWPHNGYCSFSGNVGNCWVPVSVILDLLVPPSTSLCGQDINVAAGISISGTNDATCFGQGTVIDAQGRWFMYSNVVFDCPLTCTQSCCCPTQPPPVHSCDLGTAYGYVAGSAITFNGHLTPQNCKHWGWYYFVPSGTLTGGGLSGRLLVGAGGNDITKATDVGGFTATLSGTTLTVTYTLSSGFDLSEVHIYASCNTPGSCAPGSYGFPNPVPNLSGATDTSFQTTISVSSCTNYYLIFHAKVSQTLPLATPCPTPVT